MAFLCAKVNSSDFCLILDHFLYKNQDYYRTLDFGVHKYPDMAFLRVQGSFSIMKSCRLQPLNYLDDDFS